MYEVVYDPINRLTDFFKFGNRGRTLVKIVMMQERWRWLWSIYQLVYDPKGQRPLGVVHYYCASENSPQILWFFVVLDEHNSTHASKETISFLDRETYATRGQKVKAIVLKKKMKKSKCKIVFVVGCANWWS